MVLSNGFYFIKVYFKGENNSSVLMDRELVSINMIFFPFFFLFFLYNLENEKKQTKLVNFIAGKKRLFLSIDGSRIFNISSSTLIDKLLDKIVASSK